MKREICVGGQGSGTWLGIQHSSSGKEINDMLCLAEVNTSRGVMNLQAQKIV